MHEGFRRRYSGVGTATAHGGGGAADGQAKGLRMLWHPEPFLRDHWVRV